MYETELPKTQQMREKYEKKLAQINAASNILSFTLAILAILCLIGVVVAVFVLEFSSADDTLCFILIGAFAGGAVLFALVAFLLARFSLRTEKRRNDFLERCDGEESFFVGEGTLATFSEKELVLHTVDNKKVVRVPLGEMRVFSVCTRKKAKERGEWSVVFEIPAHYLAKNKAEKNAPPALIQTDAKERLYRALEAHGIQLLGELPESDKENRKFSLQKSYSLPNAKKRRNALTLLLVGVALMVAGVLVGIFYEIGIGTILGVFGCFLTGRQAYAFVQAKAVFAVYDAGILWKESSGGESIFLKWEEIIRIAPEEQEGYPVLTAQTAYCSYPFPRTQGAWEYLEENFPEKVK